VGDFYLGVDIGRRRDLTVFWLWQKTGDVFWTRMAREMRNAPFALQRDFLYSLLDGSFFSATASSQGRTAAPVQRCCIDSTGIGAQLAEEARAAFGPVVEPVTFTLSVKEKFAVRMRRLLEERRLRLPSSKEIREDFSSIKRSTTFSGAARFAAESGGDGHADRFWAAALGICAAQRPATVFEHRSAGPRVFAGMKGFY
jgi:phage FluMu gp28-like protein